jgi:GT2 family glycosyltransferase
LYEAANSTDSAAAMAGARILPSCSVIIPSFNSAKFIDIALKSLELQTRKPDEVIVVDAGSIDATEQVVEGFRDTLNIKFLRAPKTTQGAARNVGILAAQCDTVAFLDSDDIFLSHHVESAARILADDPGIDAVRGYNVQWNAASDVLELSYDFLRPIDNEVEIFESSINLSTLTIRRRALMDQDILFAKNLRGRYCEDWDFVLRFLASGARMDYVQEPVSVITERAGSHTRRSIFWKMRFLLLRSLIDNQHQVSERRKNDGDALHRIAAGVDTQCFKAALTMLSAGRPRTARRLHDRLKSPKYRLVSGMVLAAAWIIPAAPSLFTWAASRMGGYGHWRPRTPATLRGEPALLNLRQRWLNNHSLT